MHVPYACRHAGACCSSGWPIPIERVRVPSAASLRADASWLRAADGAPDDVAGVLAQSDSGHCVFHRGGCEIQHAHGHSALPTACQHFPRVVLLDGRGTFVSLSHYCPTAADLLFTYEGRVEIVEGPDALPAGEPEGLDAREVLPPLLGARSRHPAELVKNRDVHAGSSGARSRHQRQAPAGYSNSRHLQTSPVLMDLEGYSAWEAHMVDALANTHNSADEALDRLDDDLRSLQKWRPGRDTLTDAVSALRSQEPRGTDPAGASLSGERSDRRSGDLSDESVIKRYLAARAFGSWAPYQSSDGMPAVLRHVRNALATVRHYSQRMSLKEAIRQSDLQILHLANG
jgi:Fe-S-cluster containining protein